MQQELRQVKEVHSALPTVYRKSAKEDTQRDQHSLDCHMHLILEVEVEGNQDIFLDMSGVKRHMAQPAGPQLKHLVEYTTTFLLGCVYPREKSASCIEHTKEGTGIDKEWIEGRNPLDNTVSTL